jgi:aubergine-like protein
MTEIGRNYYDLTNPQKFSKYSLEIVNGYTTAIATHEMKLLLCAEISHRLVQTQSVLDTLNNCYAKSQANYKALGAEAIIGQIVMTK